jgi:hypothetical protein
MGWHAWNYVARGHNKEAYRTCKCCPKVEREDIFVTGYIDTTPEQQAEVKTLIASEQVISAKPQFPITAWKVQGKSHVVFGENGPKTLADWQAWTKNQALTAADLELQKDWYSTIDILRTDFVIVDPDRLAYPTLKKPSIFDPFQL